MSNHEQPLGTIWPSRDAFRKNRDAGKTQLITLALIADTLTPVSAYLRLTKAAKYSLLLESVTGGEVLGRYSAIGMDPDIVWTSSGDKPIDELKKLVAQSRIDVVPEDAPPMLASGMFGYMGYGMIHHVEPTVPDTKPDNINIPDSVMMRPSLMAVFDNIRQIVHLAVPVRDVTGDADAAYDAAVQRLNDAKNTLLRGDMPLPEKGSTVATPLPIKAHTTESDYKSMVLSAKEDIVAGEIFQVVLSQRFSAPFDLPAVELYRSLRRLNPSPFLVLMTLDGFSLIASSPEIMVRVRKGDVTIRPIAGTRKRGIDKAEDMALANELLADPKERAEHLMLLDLGRNDVGRVAKAGTVKVTESYTVERYSHVMHLVSNVEGDAPEGVDPVDVLMAALPAGTLSGAPKVRAMQIIDELEMEKRGIAYAGAGGYFGADGSVDTCIVLRTACFKDGQMFIQAGGGVVADSDPDAEYDETLHKARALRRAAEDAWRFV